MNLANQLGELYSEDFLVFFEMFVFGKLKSINLFLEIGNFISKCQVAARNNNLQKMEITKVNHNFRMIYN